MEKREPFHTVGGNENWYSHCGDQYGVWRFLKNLKIELLYDSAVSEKTKTLYKKDICTPMFIETLFIIAKTKQHKCPLTGEWIKKMWYICTMEYYSA